MSRSSSKSNRIWTPDLVRSRIRTSMLVRRLDKHVRGEIEMSTTQLRAAEILLRKTLPDLSAVEHSGFVETPPTREEILARLTQLHAGAVAGAADGAAAGSAGADGTVPTSH